MTDDPPRRDGRSTIRPAALSWTEGPAPRAPAFGDLYFCDEGGEAETAHVFIQGNDLIERFAAANAVFTIGELGFGTGLNFLLALKSWSETASETARLHFISVDRYPLYPDDHARALAAFPALAPYAERLLARLPPRHAGPHRIMFPEHRATLTLLYGDAEDVLSRFEGAVDAWFLDGFAPARNESMWSEAVLDEVARLSRAGATLATYTVAGAVRRGLAEQGFTVEKRPGFGLKRDMLAGRFEGPHEFHDAAPDGSPIFPAGGWATPADLYGTPRGNVGDARSLATTPPARALWFGRHGAALLAPGARVAVIGAGIAGAALTWHLREAGFSPVVFDGAGPASGASGAAAGLLSPRLALGDQPTDRFHVDAFLYATRFYAEHAPAAFKQSGILQLATDDKELRRAEAMIDAAVLPAEELALLGAKEASEIAGCALAGPCLFIRKGGVVHPPVLVSMVLADTEVRRAGVVGVESEPDKAVVRTEDGALEAFDAVVIANALDALRLAPTEPLPLAGSLGQVTRFQERTALRVPVAFGPYAAPAPGGGLVIGATYDPFEGDLGADPARDARNRAAVLERLPGLIDECWTGEGRASVRCVTPDRTPVAGPLPDWRFAADAYAGLAQGRAEDYPPLARAPRLWALTGLGSRGFATAPLAAAFVVADMAGAPSPVERDVAEALHPVRFLIRDLKRGRVPPALQTL
ncbi:MAG: FAD-dependent 5-carboxymethylaminomethyl-2-thiouridine(34) oxidoreductase MnmC [Pseudomonadota bacterium]